MNIPIDKKLHLAVGLTVGFLVALAGLHFNLSHQTAVLFAAIAGAILGIGKEFYDKMHPQTHTMDIKDALFTAAGGLVGGILGSFVLPLISNV